MRTFLVIALSALLVACETVQTTQPGAVGVDRTQRFMVSSEEVNQAAAKEYQKVLAEAQAKGTLDRDARNVQRVRAVAGRLIPQTGAFRADAPGWPWETHVITDPQLNAWAMPG